MTHLICRKPQQLALNYLSNDKHCEINPNPCQQKSNWDYGKKKNVILYTALPLFNNYISYLSLTFIIKHFIYIITRPDLISNLARINTLLNKCFFVTVIHHFSTKERRIRAIKEMARTLRVGGRMMIYVWAMEQKHRKFEKQDIFVPWNPDPHSLSSIDRPRRRAMAQSVSEAADNADKHRKVRSTSSVADEEEMSCAAPQQRTQRLWFFSRSLDSVLDFGSLAISRSVSRENEGNKAVLPGRKRGLIKQVSSFFSPSSVIGSEEDVFESDTELHKGHGSSGYGFPAQNNNDTEKQSISLSLAQGFGPVALPDLVPLQNIRQSEEESEGGQSEEQESTRSPQGTEEQVEGSCLRYYHVFREGELAQLIQNHVEELHVKHTYFDHANWCVVAEKVQLWKIWLLIFLSINPRF